MRFYRITNPDIHGIGIANPDELRTPQIPMNCENCELRQIPMNCELRQIPMNEKTEKWGAEQPKFKIEVQVLDEGRRMFRGGWKPLGA